MNAHEASATQRFIDVDVHVPAPSVHQLAPYLSSYWNDYIDAAGFRGSMALNYAYPPNAVTTGAERSGSTVGEHLALIRRHCLADSANARAIVSVYYGVEAMGSPDFSSALSRALNDWLLAEYVGADDRLCASIVVPPQYPELAGEEIERLGGTERVVQVSLPARSAKPYGNRTYYAMLAAAERHRLTVGIQFGGMSWVPSTPCGWTNFYIEDYAGMSHVVQAQLASLIIEGSFSKFPDLRVALLETGWTWLPWFMWRMDKEWKGIWREVPWVNEPPSMYIRRHVKFSIQPIDAPAGGQDVLTTIEQIGSEDVLMFASDFPHIQGSDPWELMSRLPPPLREKVAYRNAAACYRAE